MDKSLKVVLSCLLLQFIAVSSCPVTDIPQLYKINGGHCLHVQNNSAVTTVNGNNIVVRCLANGTVVWYKHDTVDYEVTDSGNSVVHVENGGTDLHIDRSIFNIHTGVYSCRVSNTTEQQVSQLFLVVYNNVIGNLSLSLFTLSIVKTYPLLAYLSITSTNYPPTYFSWSKDEINLATNGSNPCVFTSCQHLYDFSNITYNNVLIFHGTLGCNYSGVYIFNTSSDGNRYASLNITIDKASPPRDIRILSLNENCVQISWKLAKGSVSQYYIINTETNVPIVEDNTTTLTWINVETNHSYNLLLFSTPILSKTLPSELKTLIFDAKEPDRPHNISTIEITSTTIQLSWRLIDTIRPVDQFIVYIIDNCSLVSSQINITNNNNYLATYFNTTLSKLQPGTEYCIQLASVNPWGISHRTDMMCTSTPLTEISAPSFPPSIISIANDNCNNMTIIWEEIPCNHRNGPLLTYSILVFNHTNCTGISLNFSSPDTFITLTSLEPFSDYCVQIARVNIDNKYGPYSEWSTQKTPQCSPGKVRNLVAMTTLTTARLSWEPPQRPNQILLYCLKYWPLSDSTGMSCYNLSYNLTTTQVEGLVPNRQYTFSLITQNSAGQGIPFEINATTMEIEQIEILSINWINENQVTVTWKKAISMEITSYIIYYKINNITGNNIVHNITSWTLNIITITTTTTTGARSTDTIRYSFSVVAAVTVNGIIYTGNITNTTGCYGDCNASDKTQLIVGSAASGGVCFILLVLCAVIVTLIRLRKRKQRDNDDITMTILIGGKAPCMNSPTNDINVKEGDEVVITLDITGQPYPAITWFYNNKIIADDEYYELQEENELLIHNVRGYHSGVYQYSATNALGTIEGQVRVFVVKEETTLDVSLHNHTQRNENINPILVSEWMEHVEQLGNIDGCGFKTEFQSLKGYTYLSSETAKNEENKRRNRFKTILPYDHNQVKLEPITGRGDCLHTYINASYINGYRKDRQFIATQGPLPQTLVDFWRMIWQENISCIVMLLSNVTEGNIIRCQQYWPDTGTAYYGPYKVTIERLVENNIYKERQLALNLTDSAGSSFKIIYHYQFIDWTDSGIPQSPAPLLMLYDAIKEWLDSSSPLLVHCSGGNGRTAVLLAVVIAMDQANDEGKIDLKGVVSELRRQRMNMVQTEEQYAYIHHVLLEGLYCRKTSLNTSKLMSTCQMLQTVDNTLKCTGYEAHFKALEVLSPRSNSLLCNAGLSHPDLNRCQLHLPPDKYRVILKNDTDYIHASYIDDYKQPKTFIIAESPMKTTTDTFWQMILQEECAVIVMLCDCVELREDICFPYWPASLDSERHFGQYRVKHTQQYVDQHYTELTLQVTDTKTNKNHKIVQLQLPYWPATGECSKPQSIVAAASRVESIQLKLGNKPILVHCSDTVSHSGVFCTFYIAMQQIKIEQQADIYQILKTLRTQKPGLITSADQYKTVYDLLYHFVKTEVETYENLNSCGQRDRDRK